MTYVICSRSCTHPALSGSLGSIKMDFSVNCDETLTIASRTVEHRSASSKWKFTSPDFKEVKFIGQAFADEIFRVFAQKHPDMQLLTMNTSSEVTGMIERAKRSVKL